MFEKIVTVFITFSIISLFIYVLYKRYRNFDRRIIKSLEEHNLKPKPFFKLSPFKRFKSHGVFYETEIFGLKGEEVFIRIVKFEDENGINYESWVRLWTTIFVVREIAWEVDLSEIKVKKH